MRETETLEITGPAAELWERVEPVLRNAGTMRSILAPSEDWHFGGGTILAGRWQHRESADIDIAVPARTDEPRVWLNVDDHLTEALRAAGARTLRPAPNGLSAVFDNAKLDIFEKAPLPKEAEKSALVNGQRTYVESTAQILYGKIAGRLARCPTRDLFDFAVAEIRGKHELEIAVNAVHPREVALAAHYAGLPATRERMAGRNDLRKTASRFKDLAENPADSGIRAVLGNRYREISCRWEKGVLEMHAVCSNRTERTVQVTATTRNEAVRAAHQLSIDAYLRNSRVRNGLERLQNGDEVHCRYGAEGGRQSRRDMLPVESAAGT